MIPYKSPRYPLFAVLAVVILMLAACQPAALTNDPQTILPPVQPTATKALPITQTPSLPTQTPTLFTIPTSAPTGDISLDYSSVAQTEMDYQNLRSQLTTLLAENGAQQEAHL
jgi:hypothetical protein